MIVHIMKVLWCGGIKLHQPHFNVVQFYFVILLNIYIKTSNLTTLFVYKKIDTKNSICD